MFVFIVLIVALKTILFPGSELNNYKFVLHQRSRSTLFIYLFFFEIDRGLIT